VFDRKEKDKEKRELSFLFVHRTTHSLSIED